MDGCKQLNMEDAGFFSNKEPSFKARQLFFQQKLYTVTLILHNDKSTVTLYTISIIKITKVIV